MIKRLFTHNNVHLFLLGIIVIVISGLNISVIEERQALEGWAPQDYVDHRLLTENFVDDWPNGILDMNNSILSQTFLLAAKLKISNTLTLSKLFIFIQTLSLTFAVYFLTITISKNRDIAFIFSVLVLVSCFSGRNLANLGNGYQSMITTPSSWGISFALGFFAIAFWLKERFILSAVFIICSFYVHASLGLSFIIFCSSLVIIKPKLIFNRTFIGAVVLFSISLIPFLYNLWTKKSFSHLPMKESEWIHSIKIFSYHAFPISLNRFTTASHNEFFPMVLSLFAGFTSFRYVKFGIVEKKILCGLLACALACFVGIVFSEWFPVPFIIKVGLPRSTHVISFFGALYLVVYLYKKIEISAIPVRVVCFYILSIIIVSNPGLAIFPFFLLWTIDCLTGQIGSCKLDRYPNKFLGYAVVAVFICVILLTLCLLMTFNGWLTWPFLKNLWTPLQLLNPQRELDLFLRGGRFKFSGAIFGVVFCSIVCAVSFSKGIKKSVFLVVLTMLAILTKYETTQMWHDGQGEKAQAYIAAQLWAKENTPVDSLFLVDPAFENGWRTFSQRSCFGNIREWLFTSIYYSSDPELFAEGKKRSQFFGVEIDKVKKKDILALSSGIYGNRLGKKAHERFLNLDQHLINVLKNKYGVDFIVYDKGGEFPFFEDSCLVYENNYYALFSTHQDYVFN